MHAPETVLIPGGSFTMGCDTGRRDEQPAHAVTLQAFHAAVRPVSNREYLAFVEATGHPPPPFLHEERFAEAQAPVVGVSWHDAQAFCSWLTSILDRPYRLPTEAEREYAARGGLDGVDWPWGPEPPEERECLSEVVSLERPHVPDEACINPYGLMCMADNVHEWCSDWYAADYYGAWPAESPGGPAWGRRRASRGGSWRHQVKFNRVAARSSLDPTFRYNDYGFRVYL